MRFRSRCRLLSLYADHAPIEYVDAMLAYCVYSLHPKIGNDSVWIEQVPRLGMMKRATQARHVRNLIKRVARHRHTTLKQTTQLLILVASSLPPYEGVWYTLPHTTRLSTECANRADQGASPLTRACAINVYHY